MNLTALIGTKKYQKQGFLQDGTRVPLTAVNVLGNVVTQIKTTDKEGYNSLQLGISTNKKARKSLKNHASKAGLQETPRFFKEIRVDDLEGATLGSQINASEIFAPGDMVDVTGISKGKGWAGGVKRWGFHGGPRTHGQSDRERAPGSIGQTTTPGRVYRGKKMAGRMGSDTVTVKNLEVISVTDDGIILIKGLVPGNVNGLVMVKKVGENKKFVPLYKEPSSAEASPDAKALADRSEGQVPEEVKEKTDQQSDEALRSPQEDNSASSQSHVAGDAQGSQEEPTPEAQESVAADSGQEAQTQDVKEVTADAEALADKKQNGRK